MLKLGKMMLLLLWGACLFAAEPLLTNAEPQTPPGPAAAPDLSASEAELSAASEAQQSTEPRVLRDPFCAPGYVPRGMAADLTSMPAGTAQDWPQFQIGGIIKCGSKYLATINGVLVEAGDKLPVLVDGRWVVFIVRAVDMHRVRIEPLNQ